jgi:signal transduction histidine kinase/ligand-binding sensor domain-containing protein
MLPLKLNRRSRSTVVSFAALIFVSLFGPPSLSAQLRSLDVSQYLHNSWTAQDGYFSGISGTMAQTADGYIWVLSVNRLLRFDGVRFVEWTPPNGESLPGKPPSTLLRSKDGSLWLSGHGVAELRKDGTWHRYHELDSSSLVYLAESKDGAIWAGVGGRSTADSCSLFRIDHGKAECYKRPEFAGLNFPRLYVDSAGRLWAASKIGIWQILPGPPKLIEKTDSPVDAFSEDSEGSLLYTSDGPIWKLSPEGRSENYLGNVEGTRINGWVMMRDREGGLWIGTSGEGIVHLHEGRVDHFSSFDGLSSDFVQSIFQDREGNVWVMSPGGIDKFTKPAVQRLTRKQGLSSDAVLSVLTDRHGAAWIGTDNGLNDLVSDHLIQPSPQFREQPAFAQQSGFTKQSGFALVETHTGRLVIATFDHNKAIMPNRGRMVPEGSNKGWLEGYKTVFALAEDAEGTLWAASRESGLLHLRENGGLIKAFDAEKFGDYPLSVAFDPKRDGIWFTTHQGELFFVKSDKIVERYGVADGLGYGPIRVSQVDKDGGVWVTTKVGLAHLANGKISILGRKNGLPCDALHWMRHDREHNVWLYTECGLVSFSENELSSWIAQSSHAVTITHYLDSTEGVESNANGGWFTPLSAMTKDGRILFAMRTGLGVLDPRLLNQNSLPPPVLIEGIAADRHEIGSSDRGSLPAKTGAVHIAYTALSFAAPRKVRFRYQLQGYDKDWSPPVSLREVTYTNLPPGSYTFRVIACNNSGVWNEQGARVEFTILPAFYQTRWFLFLCAATLLGLIWFVLRWRMQRVTAAIQEHAEVRADERVRIARDLHDTLLQGVQGLMLHFHVAAQELPEGGRPREAMERALATADRILSEGRNRVNSLRADHFTHKNLTEAFNAIAAEFRYEQRIRFSLKIEGPGEDVASSVLDELHYIGREAISNAFRHSKASEIAARVMCGPKSVILTVSDNGRGFDPVAQEIDRRAGHWGLRGMKERADVIGARFECNSSPNQGTQVVVTVPAHRAYTKRSPRGKELESSVSPESTSV